MARALGIVVAGIVVGLLIVWLVMSQVPSSAPQPDVTGIRRPQVTQPTR